MSEIPDHDTLLLYITDGTPLRVAFAHGEGLIEEGSLPASGIVDSVVLTRIREATKGPVVYGQIRPGECQIAFFTHETGRFHPLLTSVEPMR